MEGNTEDTQTLEDLYKNLAEIQTTNRFILRRLNHVVESGTSGTCCCSGTKSDGESEESNKDLERRLANFENKQVENADSLKHLKQQLTEIKNVVKESQENQYFIGNTPMHLYLDNMITDVEVDKPVDRNGASCLADETTVTTVLHNDAIEQQKQSSVTSDTATALQKIHNGVKRSATELSKADVDKSITNAEVNTSHSNNGTSGLAGNNYAVIELQNDDTEQHVKHHVMQETATKLHGNSIKYKGNATELSTSDVNRRITDAELNTIDTSLSNYGLSCLENATNTATVKQKYVSEQKTELTNDESGDGGTRAINIQINDTGKRNNSLNTDNVTSKLDDAFSIPFTNTGKLNGNEIQIKPVACTSKEKMESSIKTKKPNLELDRSSMNERDMPVVIEQNQKKFYEDHKFWEELAHEELHEALRNSGVMDTDGAHTVLCIDISLSMSRNDAWTHVTTFLNSYIGGLEEVAREHGFKDEHVALATFGHETRVIQRFTNDMNKLRTSLGNIKLGGPSPMYGGLEMAKFAALTPGDHALLMGHINGISVPTRIVLITDGEFTDSCMYQGPDEADISTLEETKRHLMSTMVFFQSYSVINFFCMPVGNANKDFLQLMTGVADGKMINYMDGRQFARRSYLMTKTRLSMSLGMIGQMSGSDSSKRMVMIGSDRMAGQSSSDSMELFSQMAGQSSSNQMELFSQMSGQSSSNQMELFSQMSGQSSYNQMELFSQMSGQSSSDPMELFSQMSGQSSSDQMKLFSQISGQSSFDKEDMSLSSQDKEQIEDIKKHAMANNDHIRNSVVVKSSQHYRMYLDPNSSKLPAVGTRVRRGPDLEYHMQESNGPGTVIGQYEGGMMLWVEWDANSKTDVYRYGGRGYYDLLIVDEPRNVTDGKLAVGCTVRPGKDFQYMNTNVEPQDRGVTIQINQDNNTVRVKWSNKERGTYKYSDNIQGKMEVEMCSSSSPSKMQQQNVFAPERTALKKSPYRNKNKNT